MRNPVKLLPIVLSIILVLAIATPNANAFTAFTYPYTCFVTPLVFTWENATTAYTSVTIDIACYLTFNNTATYGLIYIGDEISEAFKGIAVSFMSDTGKTLAIQYRPTLASAVTIGSGTWGTGNKTRITLQNHKINVWSFWNGTSGTRIVTDFSLSTPLQYFGSLPSGTGIATAGMVSVDVTSGTDSGMNSTIVQWMPTIIGFAMLAMVLGLFRKAF